jgi:hypothetical protein
VSDLLTTGFPQLGNVDFGISLRGMRAATSYALVFGFAPQSGVPIDLTVIGAQAGARLYLDPTGTAPGLANAAGRDSLLMPVPTLPGFLGAQFWMQQFQIDASIPAAVPIAHSAGLRVTVVPF